LIIIVPLLALPPVAVAELWTLAHYHVIMDKISSPKPKRSYFWFLVGLSAALFCMSLFMILRDWNGDILVMHLEHANLSEKAIRDIVSEYRQGLLKILMTIPASTALMNICWLFYFRKKKEI
jgi:hypothetical protein